LHPGRRHRARKRGVSFAAGALLASWLASPVAAQVAGSIALQNDYRVRGYTISGDKPVAIFGLSYDHPSGLYVNGSAIGALDHANDPVLLGAIGNIGYARRIGPRISIDAGYARTQYAHYVAAAHGYAHYDEIYAGISAGGLSAHIYVSPDYYRHDVSTIYGELDGAVKPIGEWRLTGHVGVLGYLAQPDYLSLHTQYDWRIGIARPIRRFDLHLSLTGGGPGGDYYRNRRHGKTALVGGISWSF
jgi:uncharacterized protein (TIGR02001 family)